MVLYCLKIWVFTLIEYDNVGNATVLKSFAKPAKDSPVKQGGAKIKHKAKVITKGGEEDLWKM